MPNFGTADGVGTISKALGGRRQAQSRIQDPTFCGEPFFRPHLSSFPFDHAEHNLMLHRYQIRFLDYEGVVAVDEQLDKKSDGIHTV